MKRKIAIFLSMALLILPLMASCGTSAAEVADKVAQALSGDVTGEVGKTYKTDWFEFNIKSITKVDTYAGYKAADGNQLYDVLVYEKNIFDEDIPMGTSDFYFDAETFEEYIYPIDPIDNTMMPGEFMLKPKDTAEYHMIYEIPADTVDPKLMYTEIDENDTQGATFTIIVK